MRKSLILLLLTIGCWAGAPATNSAPSFGTVDVYLDCDGQALAAYQVDLRSVNPGVTIVGIEGGDADAFSSAPYYDSAALRRSHVILAAFSTRDHLPSGTLRVARVHFFDGDGTAAKFEIHLVVAATVGGVPIPAKVYVHPGETP